jgi:hypothetical protein
MLGMPTGPLPIVGQALNSIALEKLQQDRIHSVKLPGCNKHQLIVQYVNDASFRVRVDHNDLISLMHILQLFSKVSNLLINESKYVAFRVGGKWNKR